MEIEIDEPLFRRAAAMYVADIKTKTHDNWRDRKILPGQFIDKPKHQHTRKTFLELAGLRTMAWCVKYLHLPPSDACLAGELAINRTKQIFAANGGSDFDRDRFVIALFDEDSQLKLISDIVPNRDSLYAAFPHMRIPQDLIVMHTQDVLADALGEEVIIKPYAGTLPKPSYVTYEPKISGEDRGDLPSFTLDYTRQYRDTLTRYQRNLRKAGREPTEFETERIEMLEKFIMIRRLATMDGKAEDDE